MSDVTGGETPEDPAVRTDPAGGSSGPPPPRSPSAVPASRRDVLRDLGSVLSAAAIMPMLPAPGGRRHAVGALGSAAGGLDGWNAGLSSMLVPAYFHPGQAPDGWSALADPRLIAVVLNIDDGPGDNPVAEFVSAVAPIEAVGGTVTGYVDAGYGARSVTEIETAARRYRDWYGVGDVFLDQVPAGAATLDIYRAVAAKLRAKGAELVVFNHGVYPDPGYAAVADLLVTFEGPWSAYQLMDAPPAWATALPAWRFCHLVYGVPPSALDQAVRLAGERGAGVLYVTDGQGVNPWDGLPGYFDREVTLICGQ